ncbi:MAG: DUF389 domain-containing protein [Desulfuromonadaceae bacterium]|nr:DUF389 domain-containing protein [Desulfuromonadaceae bacterium]MDD5105403.1 DUF389 domain-containing protein [Desulfuromonadaceae bacterium]
MNAAVISYYLKRLKEYLAIKTEMVNHQAVVRDVAGGVERSWIYYLMLLAAGLIALLGLLTNSVAVVIGAMLVSPLMSPIISSGLALSIGDLPLARRAFRSIAISVGLTILLTAFITLLSPLKDPTAEILARVRPNIYDLFIAVLSGIVGAVALCTKRNYLITATGVAVATAVIPPLSVAGYGLGTGQFMIGLGGFFLFFTNFVAIVLTSDLVFFIMGFRTSHVETIQYSPRKRILIVAGLLVLISIPLVYTLVVDLKKVNSNKRIERILKKSLNKENISRMTGFSYTQTKKVLDITTTVNTVSYISKDTEQRMEADLKELFAMPVDVHLEQIIVASEKISEAPVTVKAEESTAEISAKASLIVEKATRQLELELSPFRVIDTRISFSAGRQPLLLSATLHRDWPVSNDEQVLLSRHFEQLLGQPVIVLLKTVPMLSPLTFTDDGTLSADSVKALDQITQLPGNPGSYRYLLQAAGENRHKLIETVESHLTKVLQVPATAISTNHLNKKGQAELTLHIVR